MRKCLEINKNSGIERRESNCYEFIGRMHFYLGQCKEPLVFHEKALELRKKIKDKKKVATSCCTISSLYYNLCQYDDALNTHRRLLRSVKKLKIEEWRGSLTQTYPMYNSHSNSSRKGFII